MTVRVFFVNVGDIEGSLKEIRGRMEMGSFDRFELIAWRERILFYGKYNRLLQ